VLVLSVYTEALYALFELKLDAKGYVTKKSAPEELADATRNVVVGREYVTPALAAKMALRHDCRPDAAAHETLSSHKSELLLCFASGLGIEEAVARLSLSPKTVSRSRACILEKLKLQRTADLAQYAVQHGLVGGPTS
jgi:DNA-binding NarL/FixJ family response regulator